MGCFSFKCKKCGKPINSSSFHGENVRLSLLKDGKVIEEMQGQYDSYGRVFDETGKGIEWQSMEWGKIVDLMFHPDRKNGIAATHVACGPDEKPQVRSSDDPGQGWGRIRTEHMGDCEIYHKIF